MSDNSAQFSFDFLREVKRVPLFPPFENTKPHFLCVTLQSGWFDFPAQSAGAPDYFIIKPLQWLGHAGPLKLGYRRSYRFGQFRGVSAVSIASVFVFVSTQKYL